MRSCIFCGARASSKEDAWPLWLLAKLGNTGVSHIEAERGGEMLGRWETVKPGIRVRFVCAHCNNGWMSRLEGSVKNIVEPLLKDGHQVLEVEHQATLALWAVKNAMVFEALRKGSTSFYSDYERTTLMAGRELPKRTRVYIAKCVDQFGAYCSASNLSGDPEAADFAEGYVTTMVFGPLAMQVFSIRMPETVRPEVKVTTDSRPGPWDSTALQIWPEPKSPAEWPPFHGLAGEVGVEELAKRWSPYDREAP